MAKLRAADADSRAKSAEVRAKQAKYWETQALQKAQVYQAQVRGFQTRLPYACALSRRPTDNSEMAPVRGTTGTVSSRAGAGEPRTVRPTSCASVVLASVLRNLVVG